MFYKRQGSARSQSIKETVGPTGGYDFVCFNNSNCCLPCSVHLAAGLGWGWVSVFGGWVWLGWCELGWGVLGEQKFIEVPRMIFAYFYIFCIFLHMFTYFYIYIYIYILFFFLKIF